MLGVEIVVENGSGSFPDFELVEKLDTDTSETELVVELDTVGCDGGLVVETEGEVGSNSS